MKRISLSLIISFLYIYSYGQSVQTIRFIFHSSEITKRHGTLLIYVGDNIQPDIWHLDRVGDKTVQTDERTFKVNL
jgi:hypothetical protein